MIESVWGSKGRLVVCSFAVLLLLAWFFDEALELLG